MRIRTGRVLLALLLVSLAWAVIFAAEQKKVKMERVEKTIWLFTEMTYTQKDGEQPGDFLSRVQQEAHARMAGGAEEAVIHYYGNDRDGITEGKVISKQRGIFVTSMPKE